ncbi:MAG: pilus assembly protein, partial [Yonghaparkia sp.]|nr:pilus assembly protein [Microcella sp.]
MRRSSPFDNTDGCGDRGSASLEFLVAGLLMLVPLVYLILTLGTIQSAALATEGAARQAARVFVQAPSTAVGAAAA